MLLSRVAGAALLFWIGYVHLHLWQEGYRFIPTNGPFFLLDAVVAFALAAVLLVWPRPIVGVVSAAFTAGTIAALLVSLTVGLFGFHESITASFVVLSLVIESLAMIILATWTALASVRLRRASNGRGRALSSRDRPGLPRPVAIGRARSLH